MRAFTNISTAAPYDAAPGMRRLQEPAPQAYDDAAVQQHYADVYAPASQKAAVDLGRANTMAAGAYANRANAAQNQAALAGLGQLAKQRSNAQDREAAMQEMAYGWMKNMMNNSALGGLL